MLLSKYFRSKKYRTNDKPDLVTEHGSSTRYLQIIIY